MALVASPGKPKGVSVSRTVAVACLALSAALVWYVASPGSVVLALVRNTRDNVMQSVRHQSQGLAAISGFLCLLLVVSQRSSASVMAAVMVPAAGWQIPLIVERAREKERRRIFDLELTDALGEMVMGVEAGLTLESVMNLYARRHDTSLGREMARVIESVNLGSTRVQALQEFRERTPTPSVSMFVSAVQQNQKLGTPLAAVLRQQARTARRRREQAVEEYAATLALKMVFPTVFCVLPLLLIVIVGPAIVRLIHALPH